MADLIQTLPTDKTKATPEESALVESLLQMTGESSGSSSGGGRWGKIAKACLLLTSVFILLGSPWIAALFKKIPGLGNPIVTLLVQALLFLIVSGIILWRLSS